MAKTPLVLWGLAGAAGALALVVWATGLAGYQRHEGYFSPVWSADGGSVLFIRRETSGFVWGLGFEFFTPPAHVYVLADDFSLGRLDVTTGAVEVVRAWPPSPLVDRRIRTYRGRIFSTVQTLIRVTGSGDLEFQAGVRVPGEPMAETWRVYRRWTGTPDRTEEVGAWQPGYPAMMGGDESPLAGERELFAVEGEESFPTAIIVWDHRASRYEALLANHEFDVLYPDGVPERWIVERSRKADIERSRALERTRAALMERFLGEGLGEGDALLRTGRELLRLGYYAKSATITARIVNGGEFGGETPLFEIARAELRSGIFPDIEQAIASPGEPVDKSMGRYVNHDDYANSAAINALIDAGGERFLIRHLGTYYEITIERP